MYAVIKSGLTAIAALALVGGCAPQPQHPERCRPRPDDEHLIARTNPNIERVDAELTGDPRTPGTVQESQIPGGGLPGPSDQAERNYYKDKSETQHEKRTQGRAFDLPYCPTGR